MFEGKFAIITGAGSGIGQALMQALTARGCCVHGVDLDEPALTRTVDSLAPLGLASGDALDVTDEKTFQTLVNRLAGSHGRLDYLFNGAGIGAWGDVRTLAPAVWRQVFEVNYWAVVHGSLAAYPIMARQGFGHIINMSSLAGLVSAPTTVPYAAAKHAVVGFSTSLRAEGENLGVRVSVVCPGPIMTGFHAALLLPETGNLKPRPPRESMSAGDAAQAVLRGVEHNQGVIVFPERARWMWRYYRWIPPLFNRINRRTMQHFRDRDRDQ